MVVRMKIVIPKNEILWVTYTSPTGEEEYIITSNKDRSSYILYSVGSDKKLTKIAKSPTPEELYDKL